MDIFRPQGGQSAADRGKFRAAEPQQRRNGHTMDITGFGGVFRIDVGVGIHPDKGKLFRGVVLCGAGHSAQSQGVIAAKSDRERAFALRGRDSIAGGTAGGNNLLQVVGRRFLLPAGSQRDKGRICGGADAIVGEEREKTILSGDERRAAHGAASGAAAPFQWGRNKRKPHGGYLPFGSIKYLCNRLG